jgi:hypothetical protein
LALTALAPSASGLSVADARTEPLLTAIQELARHWNVSFARLGSGRLQVKHSSQIVWEVEAVGPRYDPWEAYFAASLPRQLLRAVNTCSPDGLGRFCS